jgi:hypothetical protein
MLESGTMTWGGDAPTSRWLDSVLAASAPAARAAASVASPKPTTITANATGQHRRRLNDLFASWSSETTDTKLVSSSGSIVRVAATVFRLEATPSKSRTV